MRQWFELRVRECVRPGSYINGKWVEGEWMKKSRFYFVNSSDDAETKYSSYAHKHRVIGKVMSCQKVPKEKLLGVGEFFTMGNRILKDLRAEQEGGESLAVQENSKQEAQRRQRRDAFAKERRQLDF